MRQRSLLILFGGLIVVTLLIQLPLWMVVVSRHHALHLPGRPDTTENEPLPQNGVDTDEGELTSRDIGVAGAANGDLPLSTQSDIKLPDGDVTAAVHDPQLANDSLLTLVFRRVAPPADATSIVDMTASGTHTAVVLFSLSTVDEQTLPWHVVADVVRQSTHLLRNRSRLSVSIVTRIPVLWWIPGRSAGGDRRSAGVQFEGSEVCEWFRVLKIDCRSLRYRTPLGGVVQFKLWGTRSGGGSRRVAVALARRLALTAWSAIVNSHSGGKSFDGERPQWWYFSPYIDGTSIPWETILGAGGRLGSPSLLHASSSVSRASEAASLLTVAVVSPDNVVVNGGHRLRFGDDDALLLSHEMRGYASNDARIHAYAGPSFDRVPSPVAFGVSAAALEACWPSPSLALQSSLGRWSTAVDSFVSGDDDGIVNFCFPEDTDFVVFLQCWYDRNADDSRDVGAAQSGVVVTASSQQVRSCGGGDFDSADDDGTPLQKLLQRAEHHRLGADAAPGSHNNVAEQWAHQVSQRLLEHMHGDKVMLEWETFCIPCFGFSNEVMQYLVPLEGVLYVHTSNDPSCFCPGAPSSFRQSLQRIGGARSGKKSWGAARRRQNGRGESSGGGGPPPPLLVHVAHKDPGSFPQFSAQERPDVVVGRAMYEFTKLPSHWGSHKADVDEIWVPCRFVKWVFERAGFARDTLVVIPEPIDVFFYDPSAVLHPVELPPPRTSRWNHASSLAFHRQQAHVPTAIQDSSQSKHFKFFSVFKWEERKGWEELLLAYISAFSLDDTVSLYLATYVYGETRDAKHVLDRIESFVRSRFNRSLAECPHIHIISEQLSEAEMVGLYAAADAFVLASKGEGWGLPAIQAMSMALPTLVTNWSGIVDFATERNAFLIPVAEVDELPTGSPYGAEAGKLWAVPDVSALEGLMRYVFAHPDEARHRGRRARRDVIAQFSSEAVAQMVRTRILALAREKQKPRQVRIREAVEALLDDRHLIV